MPELSPSHAAESAARDAYGRLVAAMTSRTGNVAAAEDALSQAFVAALEKWPIEGIPRSPEAWLLTVARRRHVDRVRHRSVQQAALPALESVVEESSRHGRVVDRRLQLMLLCAHPSIEASIRAPLMLQTILGLNAQQIGQAFLVSPSTMGQRLSRAKHKIRAARIPFDVDVEHVATERVAVICEALYGAFSTGYNEAAPSVRNGLVDEAIWLTRVVHEATQRHPETAGLLSLMLHVEARRSARRDGTGRYVPLERQDVAKWNRALIAEAEHLLWVASHRDQVGRFQLEAAIQSAHAHRIISGRVDWVAIEGLYRRLLEHADTLGARVARLSALAESHGCELAYEHLLKLDENEVKHHQSYWALRAHLEHRTGRDASRSTEQAVGLADDPAVRAYLTRGSAPSPPDDD